MASTYLTRTPASASNRTTWTWSAWIKRSAISTGNYQTLWNAGSGEADDIRLTITNNDQIIFGTDATTFFLTSQLFRDVSAWYHIVLAFDTTQGTASNRAKLYINGSLVSSFSTDNRSSLSGSYAYNNTVGHGIGRQAYGGSTYYDGSMAHVHFIDGTQYAASDFGETDSTTGIWKPKLSPSVTYGTNGFFLKFASSGSMGTDSSGNGNNFSVGAGNLTQTQDTPSNVFATLNPLIINRWANAGTPTNGNTVINWTSGDADTGIEFSTLGVTKGKWYWEVKIPVVTRASFGVGYMQEMIAFTNTFYDNNPSKGFSVYAPSGDLNYDNTSTSYGTAFSSNDIGMVALDMDNHLCWFGKNGTWFDSATQSEIENSTATNDATTQMGTQQNLNSGEPVFPFVSDNSTTGQASFQLNFGNGYFGTTAVSSANSDGNGIGLFEYEVPSGFYALCTKNINTYG